MFHKRLITHLPTAELDDDNVKSFPVQGRIIVQRCGLDGEQVHEVYIDAQDASWEEQSGDLISRGSFATVTSALEDLSNSGITTVHLTGALARDNGEVSRYIVFMILRRPFVS
jgi:hypothetical protein